MNQTVKHRFTCALILLFPLLAMIPVQAEAKWDYKSVKGNAECAECHEDAVDIWKETKHAMGYRDFSQRKKSKKIAKRMGVKHIKRDNSLCATCHYTIGVKRKRPRIIAGVSCESCHGPSAKWLDVHNEYGGPDVKKEQESASHKKERYAKLDKMGMNRPGNIYGFAQNCYSCHIVAKEKLVNLGEHVAGSDFDLLERTQGDMLHSPKPDSQRKQALQLTGYAVELELSLRALADAKSGKYAAKMTERVKRTLANLEKTNKSASSSDIKAILKDAKGKSFKPGNTSLNGLADRVAMNSKRYVSGATGYAFANISVPRAPAVKIKPAKKVTVKQKPASKPVVQSKPAPKVVSKPKQVSKPKVVAKPKTVKPKIKKPVVIAKRTAPPPRRVQAPVRKVRLPAAKPLIKAFKLLAPQQSLCKTKSPWMLGEETITEVSHLSSNGCVAVQLEAAAEADLYIFKQAADGTIERLVPNSCKAMGLTSNRLKAEQKIYIPQDANKQPAVINMHEKPGVTWFYMVAIDDANVKTKLQAEMANIGGPCGNKGNYKKSSKEFQALLQKFNRKHNGHLQWRAQTFILD